MVWDAARDAVGLEIAVIVEAGESSVAWARADRPECHVPRLLRLDEQGNTSASNAGIIAAYRHGGLIVERLQALILDACQAATAHENKRLRECLRTAESRLELLRFTVDTAALDAKVREFLSELEADVAKAS